MVMNVTYDLHQPGRDYKDLIAEIKTRPWCHVFESTWLIDTTETATQVTARLRNKMDANDNLLVMRTCRPYDGWLDADMWNWMKERVNC